MHHAGKDGRSMWAIEILGDSVSPNMEGYRSHKVIASHLVNCCSVYS